MVDTLERTTVETTPEVSPVRKTALLAKAVLNERGWCQSSMKNSKGEVCLLGALSTVIFGNANGFTFNSALATEVYNELYLYINRPLSYWNDDSGRTKEEVIALVQRLADDN